VKLSDRILSENRIYPLLSLYPGKTVAEVRKIIMTDLKKRMKKVIPLSLAVILLLGSYGIFSGEEDPVLTRKGVNGDTVLIPLVIQAGEEERDILLDLHPLKMTDEEIDEMQTKLSDALDDIVLGENKSFGNVTSDLWFPDEVTGFPVLLSWSTSDPTLVRTDGKVVNDETDDASDVDICARVSYGDEFRLYERRISVMPAMLSDEERQFRGWLRALREYEAETVFNEEFVLPDDIGGAKVLPAGGEKTPYMLYGLFLGSVLIAGAWSSFFGALSDKRKARFLDAERECQEFLSKLSILLAAGMPLRGAWKKITDDLAAAGSKGMLYENMAVTCREFMNGSPENIAYERFGERMEITRYQRIAAILSQAVTRGVSELPALLGSEIRDAVADEREKIKIRGEQAGTKLLMPMMGFLIIVFAVLMVPAFISF
jgi:hypothetical protein